MARKPRFSLPGFPQHVTQRGNNRQACFFGEDDYRFYLAKLADAAENYECEVHAYVLMTSVWGQRRFGDVLVASGV